MNDYLKEQILSRMRFDNPWWVDGRIQDDYREMQPRLYLDSFYRLLGESDIRRSVILMGPRRVGKTVMLFHAIQRLFDDGINPQRVVYLSIDTPILRTAPLKYPTPTPDRDRTVSRRSEPSSRTALMGEQPNPWDRLQPQDAMSRHRGAKPLRRCELLGVISLLSPG